MKKFFFKYKKIILGIVLALTFIIPTVALALVPLSVNQGGTGVNTITGILKGNGTSPFSVITVGSGLDLTGSTLSATNAGTVTSVLGTTNRITSTGGANPVIDISGSYIGQSSITTLGTITTGVWNATDVSLGAGGTGATLSDPAANKLWGWDDTDNAINFWTIGSNLSYDHATHTISATGGGTPASPDTSVQFNNGGSFGGTRLLYEEDGTDSIFKLSEIVGDNDPYNLIFRAGGTDTGDHNGADVTLRTGNPSGTGLAGNIYLNAGGGDVRIPSRIIGSNGNLQLYDYDDGTFKASLDFGTLSADHTFTFPDKDGTFAMLSDITGGTPGVPDYSIQYNEAEGSILTSSINTEGSGYTVNDVLSLTGSDAEIIVDSIDGGGGVATYTVSNPGTNVYPTIHQDFGYFTTGGTGAGFRLNVLTITVLSNEFGGTKLFYDDSIYYLANFYTGDGISSRHQGIQYQLKLGDAFASGSGAGGNYTLRTGDGFGFGVGGDYSIFTGDGGTGGDGGNYNIFLGSGVNGGNLVIRPGAGSSTNGTIKLQNPSTAINAILDTSLLTTTDKTFQFPDQGGTFALTSDIPAAGANTALSNLASVAINTSLLPATDDAIDLGSASKQWRDLYLTGSSIYLAGFKTLSSAGLTVPTGGSYRTSTSAGNTALLQAYDVDGTSYTTFGTLTANNTPTFDLSDSVTKSGGYIYRAGGTDVPITDGGTGASSAGSARTNLGATTVGSNLFTLTNPSAITFLRINADNSVDTLDAATFRTAIGAGTGGGSVTSVSGTSNRITSTGGATPVIDISASYVGQSSITTLGTIATGVWNGTAIANANLANSSVTVGSTNIALGATSTTLAGLSSVTSTTFVGALTGNADTATLASTVSTANEATDTTTFPLFVTASGTQSLQPKNNTGFIYNSNTNALTATTFIGALTGNVTGNVSGSAATVTTAAQPAITSLGTLTILDVDNININGNTIISSNTDGNINLTPNGTGKNILANAQVTSLTASEIVITDGSKNLVSAAVATYPSLTELTYLKGVTSAIQTQINAKGAGTVTSVTSANGDATVATTTTTPVITIVSAPKFTTGRTIAISGDLTYTSPSFDGSGNVTAAGTLATVNSNVGTFGSATQASVVTVNAKGLVTAASNTTVTPAVGSITGLGTGVATWLATPSSANLITVVTDETGSGALVFGTSPIITLNTASTAVTQTPADNSTKVASTAYVDNAILGQRTKEAVKYASTAALPSIVYANGSSGVGATLTGVALAAISLDSSSPLVNDRVLIKNQVSTFQNGIYTVTATGSGIAVFVLTRATDFDQASDIQTGDTVFVTAGTTLTNTTWTYNGIDNPVMGTDAITWVQAAGPGSYTAGNGISITGTSIAIDTAITADLSTAQTLTNKTLTSPKINENVALTTTATKLNFLTSAAGTTGTTSTNLVFSTSPVLTTPTLGAATYTTLSGGNITDSGLTSGRVTFASTAGLLVDSAELTFSSSLLQVGSASAGQIRIDNGDTGSGITLQGANTPGSTTATIPAVTTTLAGLAVNEVFTGIQTFSPTARTSGTASYLTINMPSDTGITTTAESIGLNFSAGTRTWADGTTVLQRERVFGAPTYNKTTTSATFTTAVNVDIADPIAGTGVTLTNNYGLRAANVLFTGVIKAGSTPTTLTDSAGKILSAALNTVAVADGGTGITSFGTGVATWLGTPSSANLAAAVTGETGSGALVFGTSPDFTTSITTGSTTFTALAGATTLLTIGGTGATAVFAIPGTLEQSSTTGALTVAGGVYIAKKLNVVGIATLTSPDIATSITTPSTSFTALAGATTLLTLGGTGASASTFHPSTLDATSSTTGAIRTSGGISAAKSANIGTTLTVGTGFQIGGAAASRKVLVGNGTNFIASTETWAVPGTSGNVLTSDGTNWTSAAPTPFVAPIVLMSTIFETAARFTSIAVSGTNTFNISGLNVTTTATGSRVAGVQGVFAANATGNADTVMMTATWEQLTIGTAGYLMLCVGDVSTAAGNVNDHFGFKVNYTAGPTATLVGSQANGTTESVTATLTTLAFGDVVEVSAKKNGSASVDYYWRKNGGAWSSAVNNTNNMPDTNGAVWLNAQINNAATATTNAGNVASFTYQR